MGPVSTPALKGWAKFMATLRVVAIAYALASVITLKSH
jgi:hypothetical protein